MDPIEGLVEQIRRQVDIPATVQRAIRSSIHLMLPIGPLLPPNLADRLAEEYVQVERRSLVCRLIDLIDDLVIPEPANPPSMVLSEDCCAQVALRQLAERQAATALVAVGREPNLGHRAISFERLDEVAGKLRRAFVADVGAALRPHAAHDRRQGLAFTPDRLAGTFDRKVDQASSAQDLWYRCTVNRDHCFADLPGVTVCLAPEAAGHVRPAVVQLLPPQRCY